jgi:hypothetical protein
MSSSMRTPNTEHTAPRRWVRVHRHEPTHWLGTREWQIALPHVKHHLY